LRIFTDTDGKEDGPMTLTDTLRQARGSGKKTVARLARRVLPRTTIGLSHLEPGLRLTVNLRRHVMFWSGGLARFEPATVRVLRAAIRPGDVVFDVGANIGFFATLFSRWVGTEGRVIAVEPEPANLVLLRHNLESNRCDNVTVCECAVGSEPGLSPFSMDEATGATGHLGRSTTAGEVAVGTGKLQLIEMRVETIDRLVAIQGVTPRVMKLDIEGGELDAIDGASRTLASGRPVIVSELTGERGPDAVGLLARLGYRIWDLESGRPLGAGPHPFMVVAIPDEHLEEERGRLIMAALRDRD
jgi:FkbM family methyltransferase